MLVIVVIKFYKRENKNKSIFITFFTGLLLGLISVYLFITYKNIELDKEQYYSAEKISVSTNYSETVDNLEEKSKNISDIIENVSKCVCGISKLSSTGGSILSTATETDLGLGTGIVVSSNGYILSNSHVTGEKFSTCYVTIEDNNTYKGNVVWSNTDLDLSIIKISASDLDFVTLGNSSTSRVGETIYAIGNPIGFEFRKTVTSGIISAVNRTIKIDEQTENNDVKSSYMSDLIQIDATINPGNSGGPLIYPNGDVIGINSVKISSAEGIGFAVPIDVVKPVINSFVQNNSFEEASLGIFVYDESVAKYLNLEKNISSGVYIAKINQNSFAFKSNLKEGDIINKIDGNSIKTVNDLKAYVFSKSPGDIVLLNVLRNEKSFEIQISLGKKN